MTHFLPFQSPDHICPFLHLLPIFLISLQWSISPPSLPDFLVCICRAFKCLFCLSDSACLIYCLNHSLMILCFAPYWICLPYLTAPIGTESTESVTDFSFFNETLVPVAKKKITVKTGLIGGQFSSKWCHFSTTVKPFNHVIHHNDKVKVEKLSSFTLTCNRETTAAVNNDTCFGRVCAWVRVEPFHTHSQFLCVQK